MLYLGFQKLEKLERPENLVSQPRVTRIVRGRGDATRRLAENLRLACLGIPLPAAAAGAGGTLASQSHEPFFGPRDHLSSCQLGLRRTSMTGPWPEPVSSVRSSPYRLCHLELVSNT